MNKFVEMWDYTNILHDHRNNPTKKLESMQKMINLLDAKTREHFRAALTQVLRDERNANVRQEAIKQLGIYFTWSELEWSWWLHQKRCRLDIHLLETYKYFSQHKSQNGMDVQLLMEAIKSAA